MIPARAGSKRVPQKNITKVNGVPMIVHTIKSALTFCGEGNLYVSTDSEEIAHISENAGAKVPFLRSPQLADDHTPTLPVIKDFLERLHCIDEDELIMCIYPTCVFFSELNPEKLLEYYEDGSFIFPVKKYSHPIQRSFSLDDHNRLKTVDNLTNELRTQDAQSFYHDAGQFYLGSHKTWVSAGQIIADNAIGVPTDSVFSVDIDTLEDLYLVRALMRYKDEENESYF